MVPFTLAVAVWFSAVVGCGRRSDRGPPAGLRGRSATWGTGAGTENFAAERVFVVLESFQFRGRRGSALVAWRTRPAIIGTYQNDEQRGCVCSFIVADGSGGMTLGQHLPDPRNALLMSILSDASA